MKRTVRFAVLAGLLAALLVLPAGAAFAGDGHRGGKGTGEIIASGVPADLAGTYVWSGDLFGTGTVTTASYTVEVDSAGIASIVAVAVDEATLPAGATVTGQSLGSGWMEHPGQDGDPVLVFRSRAKLTFELEGARAAAFIRLIGRLGDEPMATLKNATFAAPPPVEEEPEDDEVEQKPVVDDDTDDADDNKDDDGRRRKDRDGRHRHHDHDHDHDRDHHRGDRWGDKWGDKSDVSWDGDRDCKSSWDDESEDDESEDEETGDVEDTSDEPKDEEQPTEEVSYEDDGEADSDEGSDGVTELEDEPAEADADEL